MKTDAAKLIDYLGPEAIAKRIGVSLYAVRYAKTGGKLPSSWYAAVKEMADAENIPCPEAAFSFKGVA